MTQPVPSPETLLEHREWLRAIARRLVGDENVVDDVEQRTWLAVMRNRRPVTSVRGWLRRVVRSSAVDEHRSESRRRAREEGSARPEALPATDHLAVELEAQRAVAQAVAGLPEPYRTTVLLRYIEELAIRDVAARMDVPVRTVETRLRRALALLRDALDREFGDRRAWTPVLLGIGAKGTPPAAPATGGGVSSGAAAALAGGLAMGATAKLIVAATVVVVGAAWWVSTPSETAPARTETSSVVAPRRVEPGAGPAVEPRHRARGTDEAPGETAADAPSVPAPDPLAVHGRVIDDETNAPVANVTVSLVNALARVHEGEPGAVTDAAGTFSISDASFRRFDSIVLQSIGHPTSIRSAPWRSATAASSQNEVGDLRIHRGKRIEGRVVAADGRTPVPGARLLLSRIAGVDSTAWLSEASALGRSAADGTFALDRVPPCLSLRDRYTLFALGESGVGWTTLPGDAGKRDATGIEVRLRGTGTATVTVRSAAGTPVLAARVLALPRFAPLGPPLERESHHDAFVPPESGFDTLFGGRTDAAGAVRFARLPIDDGGSAYEFVAYGADGTKGWIDRVRVLADGDATIEITISEARTWAVAGVVRDADGAPVGGAEVKPRWGAASVTTDSAGTFRLEGLAPSWDRADFEISRDDFAKSFGQAKAVAGKDVVETVVLLERAMPIEGRVVDQHGTPVPGVTVSVMRGRGSGATTTAGPDGRFNLVASAGEWSVFVQPPEPFDEWEPLDPRPTVKGGDRGVDVVLQRVAAGRARIVADVMDDATGGPLAPEEVMLIPAVDVGRTSFGPAYGKVALGTGTVVIDRVKPGRWRLWVRVPDRAAAVVGVDVAEDASVVNVQVLVGRGGTLRGRVETADTGAKMPGFVFIQRAGEWTRPQWGDYQTARSIGGEQVSADGTFEFQGVAPGRHRLWIEDGGCVGECFVSVPAGGEATCVVTLAKAGRVSFRLAGGSASEIVVFEVAQGDAPWKTTHRLGGQKGKRAVHDATLRPGTWRWRVSFPADNFSGSNRAAAPAAQGEVTVGAGETVVVDVPVAGK